MFTLGHLAVSGVITPLSLFVAFLQAAGDHIERFVFCVVRSLTWLDPYFYVFY